jgi:hypothetical protein
MVLALSIGLVLAVVVVGVVHREIRSAYQGVTLSNGTDVLVSPAEYEEILARFEALEDSAAYPDLDDDRLWDEAILGVLRAKRPVESRFLARSLSAEEPWARVPHARTRERVAR